MNLAVAIVLLSSLSGLGVAAISTGAEHNFTPMEKIQVAQNQTCLQKCQARGRPANVCERKCTR